MRIFISHSSRDAKIATAVCCALEASGHSCFIAPRDIKAGREYAEEIVNGIDEADILLLLLSVQSNQSPHVLREVERAGSRRIPIMVYKLEEVELTKSLEYFLMTNQWIDGTEDFHCSKVLEAFSNLPDSSVEKRVPKQTDMSPERQGKKQSVSGGKQPSRQQRGAYNEKVPPKKSDPDKGKQTQMHLSRNIKKIALAFLLLLLICGVIFGITRIWGGTKGTVFKGVVLNSMAQGAENGRYNYDGDKDYWTTVIDPYKDAELEACVRGSNLWSDSNIRTWLNSERENVVYEDQTPAASAMSEKKNGYSNEAGFLHGFTKEELDVLRETEIYTWGNILISSEGIWTVDRQALLKLMR